MTGYNQFSNVRSGYNKERFTAYDDLYVYLTSKGSSFRRVVPLYSIGSDGNDSNIIGHWGWDNTYNMIVPMGEILFSKITDGGHAIVESVTNSTTVVCKTDPVSTLAASGRALVFDLSAGVNLYNDQTFTFSSNTLTLPNTTGIAAGDVIYQQGRSEFTWGSGSAFNIHPRENCTSFMSGVQGIYVSGSVYPVKPVKLNFLGGYRKTIFSSSFTTMNLAQLTSSVGLGWHTNNVEFQTIGPGRNVDGARMGAYTNTTWALPGSSTVVEPINTMNISFNLSRTGGVDAWVCGASLVNTSFGGAVALYTLASYPAASTSVAVLSSEPSIIERIKTT